MIADNAAFSGILGCQTIRDKNSGVDCMYDATIVRLFRQQASTNQHSQTTHRPLKCANA
jgi:hypothetical protein